VEWYWQGKTEGFGENPVPVPLCLPQIPHLLSWERTRTSAMRSRQLTTRSVTRPAIADSFSREGWAKSNQKKALRRSGKCVVYRLYSCASRPISVGSRGTEPNWPVLPNISYNRVRWFRPDSQWFHRKTWQRCSALNCWRYKRLLRCRAATEGFG
jgi:hypothetical protein